jgi:1-acyl-sn-glycerol-3-phosphate acyltransferase
MSTWHYDSASDLDQPMTDRLRHFPREPDILIYGLRSFVALMIRVALRAYNRFQIFGAENLPVEESFVLVANHSSHLDTVCLLSALPVHRLHRAFPAAAVDYFFESVPRLWIASVVANALPFERSASPRHSITVCRELLATPGNVLIIFPEGTRSSEGAMREFKAGIGALVAGRNVKVLPCYLDGAFRAWPKGSRLPRPRKIRLFIGAPRCYAGVAPVKATVSAIAAELYEAVTGLREQYAGH